MTTKLPAPNMRGFLRPTVSKIKVMKLSQHIVEHYTTNALMRAMATYKKFVMGPTAP